MLLSLLDRRPIVVALAGPNGAGKTTFYYSNLQPAGLRLVNADGLARELRMDPSSPIPSATNCGFSRMPLARATPSCSAL